jgi:hypothetical protein
VAFGPLLCTYLTRIGVEWFRAEREASGDSLWSDRPCTLSVVISFGEGWSERSKAGDQPIGRQNLGKTKADAFSTRSGQSSIGNVRVVAGLR